MSLDLIPIITNTLLLLVTALTVRYASRTLHMEYSSQIIVSNYSRGTDMKKYYPFEWRVTIKNVGKGYVVKAFILLSVKRKGFNPIKLYYLSRPIVELFPNDKRKLVLQLGEKEIKKGHFKNSKLEVIYQDSLGNIYSVIPRREGWNKHLETFDILPKRMSKFGFKYWMYLLKMKMSKIQGNTSPGRLKKEMDKMEKKLEPIIKAIEKTKWGDTE